MFIRTENNLAGITRVLYVFALSIGVTGFALTHTAVGQDVRTLPGAPVEHAPTRSNHVYPPSAPVGGAYVSPCTACIPASQRTEAFAIDSADCQCPWPAWSHRQIMQWNPERQGEYIGPARWQHVEEYRLRVDDSVDFVYRLTRERLPYAYRLSVGDSIRLEILKDETVTRELNIQPDGTILVPFVGSVMAAERTAEQLQRELTELLKEHYRNPIVLITPVKVNTRLEDLRAAVDRRAGNGGQSQLTRVSPDGTIQLPGIDVVRVQGLTLAEAKEEIDAQYDARFGGMEVTPILVSRAPRFIYVLGEVNNPGRFELQGPTSLMQAIALAGGWKNGANFRQIVVFRRDEDWRLKAVMLNVTNALFGNCPLPKDEIWLRDSDIVLLPQRPVKVIDDAIQLVFTEGFYRVFPFLAFGNGFNSLSRVF